MLEIVQKEFPAVEHIHGTLYKIPINLLTLPKSGLETTGNIIQFGNPRYVDVGGQLKSNGLDAIPMKEIRESIKAEGLKHPLSVRPFKDGDKIYLQIVDGERRYRCLNFLIKENAECWDAEKHQFVSAPTLYQYVICHIDDIDDEAALRVAISLNERAESIGDTAILAVVKLLRICGKTDDDILRITGRSISWLRETDEILSLDDGTIGALRNGDINRKVALHLAKIKVAEDRLDKLEKVRLQAAERICNEKARLDAEINRLEGEEEVASASCVEATLTGGDVEDAQESLESVRQLRERKRHKRESLRETATSRDYEQVSDGENKPLSAVKVRKFWLKELDELVGDVDVDQDDVELIKRVLTAFINGESVDGKPVSLRSLLLDCSNERFEGGFEDESDESEF